MDFTWIEGILYGFIAGLTEIIPVSSLAHRQLMLKLFGGGKEPVLLSFMIQLGILAALYYSCQTHIVKVIRAKRLARIPKSRRKRPLDTRSLMDLSLFRTMLLPVILVFLLYSKLQPLLDKMMSQGISMVWLAVFLLINGAILYVPQFFPAGNRDSRNMSRIQGVLIGLGGAVSVVPGLSGIGAASSIGSLCGVDPRYGFNMTLLMNMGVATGFAVYDLVEMITYGTGSASFSAVLVYILSAAAAFGAALGGIRIIRLVIANVGMSVFAYYCWGVALFSFIMNLLA